jgi:tetratricopeptide (TPR) repeat protein
MKPHAFIAMPFGVKPGHDGLPVDFDRVYAELIRPALEDAGCEVFRADEEQRAGDIRTDMFQELLVADLVVADLTLDNPNVWYELGVRHALRARGVVLVQGPRPSQPFDIYTDRKLRYALVDGAPDPATLAKDRDRLTAMARETIESSAARKVSPVYVLLDHLREPQWRDLLLAERNEFSDAYQAWAGRIEVARRRNLPGDILVLAGETPTRALALEARRMAGISLVKARHFDFALEQFEAALAIDPDDKSSREKRAVCLGRIGRIEDAREATRRLTQDYPTDAECWALAGRVAKDDWIARWRQPGASAAQMRASAAAEDALLEEAIEPYRNAFVADPSHFYSGINALTLTVLRVHLGGANDPAETDLLLAGVRWAVASALARAPKDYWARAAQAEASLLCFDRETLLRDWRAAMATANRDWFAIDAARQTLETLRDLEFRPGETAAALAIVDAEIARAPQPFVPRQVLLSSGHMIDAPGRDPPRFPPSMEARAVERIAQALDAAGAGAGDLALCQAAAGSDLLFLEACLERGVRCQVLLPFAEPQFIEQSVLPSQDGERWRERYFAVKARLADPPRIMPTELGPLPSGADPYERCNLWLLYTALAFGVDKVRFFALWNGSGGDGPGGTAHMYGEVKRRTGQVTWIDTRQPPDRP